MGRRAFDRHFQVPLNQRYEGVQSLCTHEEGPSHSR
jgi:hypothetical protein